MGSKRGDDGGIFIPTFENMWSIRSWKLAIAFVRVEGMGKEIQ